MRFKLVVYNIYATETSLCADVGLVAVYVLPIYAQRFIPNRYWKMYCSMYYDFIRKV